MTNLRKRVYAFIALLSTVIIVSQLIFYKMAARKFPTLPVIYNFLRDDKSQQITMLQQSVCEIFQPHGTHEDYVIKSNQCRIPYIHPLHTSIQEYFKFPAARRIKCPIKWSLTYERNQRIFINQTIVKISYKNSIKFCVADDIIRVNVSDREFTFRNERSIKKEGVQLRSEFTRVRCYNKTSKKPTYVNVYVKHVRKSDADRTFKRSFPPHQKKYDDTFNVLLIGIDTSSRMNFERYANKTRLFLLNKLKAAEFMGFHVIGENTFPNIVGLLSGNFITNLPWNRDMEDQTFDRFNFIFKEYERAGYTTLIAEDDPFITTFNYLKPGFVKQPVHYYFRPMAYVMEKFQDRRWKSRHCYYEKTEQSIVLDYIDKFIRANVRENRPFFGFSLLTRLTHDSFSNTAYIDAIHLPFLRRLLTDNTLRNTFLIYYSDHGFRHGRYRQTEAGALEARLPMLFIAPPEQFKTKYSVLWNNLQENAKKLMSPFDLYATLQDILYFKSNRKKAIRKSNTFGLSLLRKLPNRNCKEAGIPYHWCSCPTKKRLSPKLPIVVSAAKYFVSHLNAMISKHSRVCETLTVANITRVGEITDVKYTFYKFILVTKPGEAVFEASVIVHKNGKFSTSKEISRLSIYGNTSWCVHDTLSRRICYCKVQHNLLTYKNNNNISNNNNM